MAMAQCGDASGVVDWAVIETVTGKVLGEGQLDLSTSEVLIDKHYTAEQVMYYRKRVCLFDSFSIAFDEHPGKSADDVKGFGFTASNEGQNTYSWEWFNVVSPTEAVKLQEEGTLAIEIAQVACGWEVVRTEFLTDASLRLTRFFGDPSQEPYWRVTIKKGSWISWPSVE